MGNDFEKSGDSNEFKEDNNNTSDARTKEPDGLAKTKSKDLDGSAESLSSLTEDKSILKRKFEIEDNVQKKFARAEIRNDSALWTSFQGLRKNLDPAYPKFSGFKTSEPADDCEKSEDSNEPNKGATIAIKELGGFAKTKTKDFEFCIDSLSSLTEAEFETVTGLPNVETFWQFYNILDCDQLCPEMEYLVFQGEKLITRTTLYGRKSLAAKIMYEDELLLFLMKLRLNLVDEDLGQRFKIPTAVVSAIIYTWTNFIYESLVVKRKMPIWPSRKKVTEQLPKSFSEDLEFKNLRSLVVELEVLGEKIQDVVYELDPFSFSALSTSKVWKVLVGITPNGAVNYISPIKQSSSQDVNLQKVVAKALRPKLSRDDIIVGPTISGEVRKEFENAFADYVICSKFAKSPQMVLIRQLATKYLKRLLSFKLFTCIPCDLQPLVDKLIPVTILLTNLNKPILDKVSH